MPAEWGHSVDVEMSRTRAVLEPLGIQPASVDRGLIERLNDYAEVMGFGRRLPVAM